MSTGLNLLHEAVPGSLCPDIWERRIIEALEKYSGTDLS